MKRSLLAAALVAACQAPPSEPPVEPPAPVEPTETGDEARLTALESRYACAVFSAADSAQRDALKRHSEEASTALDRARPGTSTFDLWATQAEEAIVEIEALNGQDLRLECRQDDGIDTGKPEA